MLVLRHRGSAVVTAAAQRFTQHQQQHQKRVASMSVLSGPRGPRPNDAKTGERGQPMAPIPSASLIVLCPVSSGGNSTSGGAGAGTATTQYATLMLQRSARDGSSFRLAIVFPGGALDLADEEAVQRSIKASLSPCSEDRRRDSGSSKGDSVGESSSRDSEADAAYIRSLRLCALRETFEETGLLLLPAKDHSNKSRAVGPSEAGISSDEWKRLREEIHNDARAFPPFLNRIVKAVSLSTEAEVGDESDHLLPPLAPMSHHSNWVTPRAVVRPAKRFDAHFFLTILDKANSLGPLTSAIAPNASTHAKDPLSLSADGIETTHLRLATAEEMIELAVSDKIVLFPPQFYILADLAASLRTSSKEEGQPLLPPLVFRFPTEPPSSAQGVTPVEEEPRGLHPQSTYQFEKRSRQPFMFSGGSNSVTCVEPRALPTSGSSVQKASLSMRGNGEHKSTIVGPNSPIRPSQGEDDEEDTPFVFPLVLPGDFLASRDQQSNMGGASPSRITSHNKPLNRVYVTPRSREDGGGLIVRGARRRGLPGLVDFEEGARLEEMGSEELDPAEDEREGRARL